MSKVAEEIKVCSLEDIPPQGGRLVRLGDKDIALIRTSTDSVFALDNKCPHKDGPLVEGVVTGTTLICSLHAEKIDMKTGEPKSEDLSCVTTYKVTIKEGSVYISGSATLS